MVNISIDGEVRLRASNVEFKLPKPSYTIDTLNLPHGKIPRA
jgi:nicotinate-nucleotide adenylyltransferase